MVGMERPAAFDMCPNGQEGTAILGRDATRMIIPDLGRNHSQADFPASVLHNCKRCDYSRTHSP